ncbi:MAG: hypothetical protein SGILL_001966 [Bacillariaceae sp.]
MNSTSLFILLAVAVIAMMSGSVDAQVRGRVRKAAVDNKYGDLPSELSAADMLKIKARYLQEDKQEKVEDEEEEDMEKEDDMEMDKEEDDEEMMSMSMSM